METDGLVLTSDTDFLTEYGPNDHAGVLFQPDDELSPYRVASTVGKLASHLTRAESHHAAYITENWLRTGVS